MKYDYDLLVIGGGAAGLTAAGIGTNLGAKTMLIEAERLGGDCTWTGCIPSKTLLHVAGLASKAVQAQQLGLEISSEVDFPAVMEHVRSKRQFVYEEADHPDHFREMGIDIAFGQARFRDDHTVFIQPNEGNGQTVSSRYIIIATGSRPVQPDIPGLENVAYYTTENIFDLTDQPANLGIIGAGPIGVEMGQAFQRLGTPVTIFDEGDRILSNDDPELAAMLKEQLCKEGIHFELSVSIDQISKPSGTPIKITGQRNGKNIRWTGDTLLLATGRAPAMDGLALEQAGVEYSQKGIIVDDRCRTNVGHIFAAGDVTGRYQFTHMSEHMAKVAATNALLKIPMKVDSAHVPWCTYTSPELAQVGATQKQLEEQGTVYQTYRFPYEKIDRAITEDATNGLIKVFAKKLSGKILGASIYGQQASNLISEYAVAMKNGVTLRNIADTIHPYPTYGLGARRAADQWYVQAQSVWLTKLIRWIFGYRGSIPDMSDEDRVV